MAAGEALQIAVKRREAKSKGEKEIYKHPNAEFQRIARRDKKAFFSDQCKEIEENNRMGKTRDLFKKLEIPREHFIDVMERSFNETNAEVFKFNVDLSLLKKSNIADIFARACNGQVPIERLKTW